MPMMPDSGPARVLLVDDDTALLDALSQTLHLHMDSTNVETCDNATDALARIAVQDFDVIISDIKMPGVDGLELLTRIHQSSPDVPVLLITGHGETDLAIQALRLQAYDLVQKPFDREYLITALTHAIETRRLRAEVRSKQEALEQHAIELEDRVLERTQELQRANRAKDEFLGLVSHEINTPLTVIVGYAELLNQRMEELTNEERHQVVLDLRQESRRLHRIIENLLVLGRAELGAKVRTEPVNLNRVVEEQVRAHRQWYPRREVTLCCAEEIIISGDDTYIELVLRNLMNNAEKYSDQDQPIEVVLAAEGNDVSVSVLDRGRGVSPDEAEKIFEPFYRSDSVADNAPGVGIGLAVCKRLIEIQGGSIAAAPREGGGSQFTFRLTSLAVAADA
jgi:signal transduction histidine kinase